jgi:hypothetical protein
VSDSSQPKNYTANLPNLTEYKDINDFIISVDGSDINLSYNNTMAGEYNYASDTITLTGAAGTTSLNYPTGTYTIPALTTSQISQLQSIQIDQYDSGPWSTQWNQEWQHRFPDWSRVQDMCSKYPGLKIAFDNFKTFYEMCKDDYDNPTPKK